MAQAKRHYHHGRMSESAASYQQAADAAERRVDRDEAMYRSAKALQRDGQDEQALPLLDEVAARRPPSRRTARAALDAARVRLESGARAQAIASLKEIAASYPNQGPAGSALMLLMRDYDDREDDQGAIRFLDELFAQVHDSDLADDCLMNAAVREQRMGERDAAVARLQRIVSDYAYPQGERWDEALTRLADIYEEAGDPALAAEQLERVFEVHDQTSAPGTYTMPTFAPMVLRAARLYRDVLRDNERARSVYHRFLDGFTRSIHRDDAMLDLAEMADAEGDTAGACAWYERILEEREVGRAFRTATERRTQCE